MFYRSKDPATRNDFVNDIVRAAKLRLLNFLSLFRDLQKPTRFIGGGVVAEFFRDLQEPTRFSGGGVVAEFFRDLQVEPTWFSGGG